MRFRAACWTLWISAKSPSTFSPVDADVINTGAYRPNLSYQVLPVSSDTDKQRQVLDLVRERTGATIVYAATVRHVETLGQVFRTEGVERVEEVRCDFTRTKGDAIPRQGAFVFCPAVPGERNLLPLAPEETVSVDLTTFTLTTVA